MEELNEFCQAGMPITLSSSWEELKTAKKVLASHGYIQSPNDAEDVVFVKPDTSVENPQSRFIFPSEVPGPEYMRPEVDRSDQQQVHGEWTPCRSWIQLDTNKRPLQQMQIEAQIPNGSISRQRVGIRVVIHPFVKVEEAQLSINLRIATLIVGVPRKDFLTDEVSLGYYPDFISIQLEPELPDSSTVAIPIYVYQRGQNPTPSPTLKCTSATAIGGGLGFGPAKFTLQHTRGQERETMQDEHRLVPVVSDSANAASFEWTILRWGDGKEYVAESPHSRLSFPFLGPPKLPFSGRSTAAMLDKFPDAVWHLKRDLQDKSLNFELCLQFQMRLVWFLGSTRLFRSTGSVADQMEFKHRFTVELP